MQQQDQPPPAKKPKLLNKVIFTSYYLPDFTFEAAQQTFSFQDLSYKPLPELSQLRKAYSAISKEKPWPFVLPYMYRHISNSSTGFKEDGYYNYVLGYPKDQSNNNMLVLRMGHYDPQAVDQASAKSKAQNAKSKSAPQTLVGIKHMQLGSIDLDIVFAGVLIISQNKAMVSPMSGTWFEIMQQYLKESGSADNADLMNALNIMNIICTSHAVKTLQRNPPEPVVTIMSCCEKTFTCKYTKASCKPPQDKVCQSVSKPFPNLAADPDLTCAYARLDINNMANSDPKPIECFHNIPEILAKKPNNK